MSKIFGESFLRELVQIDSATTNRSGVSAVIKHVESRLRALNLSTRIENGVLLGETANPSSLPWITLVTHADTVFEKSIPYRLSEDHQTATGSGTIDDKGGIVVAVNAIELFINKINKPKYPIRFVCTPAEEAGSPQQIPLLKELGLQAKVILGLEPAFDDGSIIESRKGNRWYEIKITGRESHSGRNFDFGVNAGHEMIHKLAQILSHQTPMKEATISVGSLQGGSGKFNVVCGECTARVDFRFKDFESRDQIHQEIEKIITQKLEISSIDGYRCETQMLIVDDCPPMASGMAQKKIIQKHIGFVADIEGRVIEAKRSGGASDCNYMSHPHAIVLDGLGPYGGGMHEKQEFITLKSLETRAEALARLLAFLQENVS